MDAAAERLGAAGVPQARRDAELLLAWLLRTDRGVVVARRSDPLDPDAARRFEELCGRRERREPFAYLTGEQEFFGLAFRVDPRVLVPRPETEHVVESVLRLPLGPGARVVDLGTGSGCIAIALALARPGWRLFALDRSAGALELARENAVRHGVDGAIELAVGDLADPPAGWLGRMDAVVSNPPYVSESEWQGLAPEVREHEPRDSLVPGPTGLEAYEALAPAARWLLGRGGWLVVELGYRSEAGAREALEGAGFVEPEVRPDLRGIPRVLLGRRP